MSQLQNRSVQITIIDNSYPLSVVSVEDLGVLMIKDLILETNHRGLHVLLKFLCSSMRMTAVINVAEGEAETASPFTLYLQPPELIRIAGVFLRKKSVAIIKAPYFKIGINGQYAVRVHYSIDLKWLLTDGSRLPAKWRTKDSSTSESTEY